MIRLVNISIIFVGLLCECLDVLDLDFVTHGTKALFLNMKFCCRCYLRDLFI